jgi:hypothetical protein
MKLEEFVHLLEHLFDALADGFTLFGEGGEFGFDHGGEGLLLSELGTERGYFGFGGGAGFALALYDFDGTEDFLLEGLELVGADAGGDGGRAHIDFSIDGEEVDFLWGKVGWNLFGCEFVWF